MRYSYSYPILIASLLLSLVGFALLTMVPVQLKPNEVKPGITIGFSWGPASPRAVEQEITALLEGALNTVRGVSGIQSESGVGSGRIRLSFLDGTDMQVACKQCEPINLEPMIL